MDVTTGGHPTSYITYSSYCIKATGSHDNGNTGPEKIDNP